MPTYTAIDPTRLKSMAKAVHLATRQAEGGTYGTVQDAVRFSNEYDDAIIGADAAVYAAIMDNKEHRYRMLFVQEEIISTSGDTIAGEFVGGVRIIVSGISYSGIEVPPDVITQLALQKPSYGDGTTNLDKGYYALRGQKIYFIGNSAAVEVIPQVPGSFPVTPIDYESLVFFGLMASITPREAEYVEVANHYANLWAQGLDMIRQNVSSDRVPADKPPYSLIYRTGV